MSLLHVSRVDWRAEAEQEKRAAAEWQSLAMRLRDEAVALSDEIEDKWKPELQAERERRENAERELAEERTLVENLRRACEAVVDRIDGTDASSTPLRRARESRS